MFDLTGKLHYSFVVVACRCITIARQKKKRGLIILFSIYMTLLYFKHLNITLYVYKAVLKCKHYHIYFK